MKYSKADISRQAVGSGLAPDILEKAVRLLLFLDLIEKHPFLQGKLLLKGGTALNMFYMNMPRLSVDIDLNFVGCLDLEELLEQRPEIERAITAAAHSEDYSVSFSADSHAGRKLYLQYTNFSGMRDRIEVDINYMFRKPLSEPELKSSKFLMSNLKIDFRLVGWNELIAGKLIAAIDRVAPRDIYDLAKAYTQIDLENPVFRATCVGLSVVLAHPLYTYDLHRFDKVDKKSAETVLRPFLHKGADFDYNELKTNAVSLLSWLLDLNKKERLYIERIAEGQIKPELLLPSDPVFCENLRKHPALLWKVQNVLNQKKR